MTPCCPSWVKCSFGNVLKSPFAEVWNSETAQDFRERILQGDYSLCKLENCKDKWRSSKEDIKRKYYDNDGKIKLPEEIKMAWDKECNVACITCRDEIKRNDIHDRARMLIIENNLHSTVNQLKSICCSGEGDPFGSKYCRDFLKRISQDNEKIKWRLKS